MDLRETIAEVCSLLETFADDRAAMQAALEADFGTAESDFSVNDAEALLESWKEGSAKLLWLARFMHYTQDSLEHEMSELRTWWLKHYPHDEENPFPASNYPEMYDHGLFE